MKKGKKEPIEAAADVIGDLFFRLLFDGAIAVIDAALAHAPTARLYEQGHGEKWGNHKLIDKHVKKLTKAKNNLLRQRAEDQKRSAEKGNEIDPYYWTTDMLQKYYEQCNRERAAKKVKEKR